MCTNPKEILVKKKTSDPNVRVGEIIKVPCGVCLECQEAYSREWAFRIMHEASFHIENCFLTLTYANNPIELVRSDLQKFIKRLRKYLDPIKVRYFYCGEYGKLGGRPHYHIILFGWIPKDLIEYKKDKSGYNIWISPKITDIWGLGFTTVEEITLKSAFYCCKYMQKFQKISASLVQPFIGCSTHPGIGYFAHSVSDLNTDKIYYEGKSIHIPRYYLKKLEEDGFDLSSLRDNRLFLGKISESETDLERRRLREKFFLDSL